MRKPHSHLSPRRSSGFTLIELMVALLLGLLVLAAALGLFLTNQRTYRATENLSRVQENARAAFELLAADIRAAGGNPCGRQQTVAGGNTVGMSVFNVLNNPTANWWSNWGVGADAIIGFGGTAPFADAAFGTGAAQRVSGTDALQLMAAGNRQAVVVSHDEGEAKFVMRNGQHGFQPGQILMVCGPGAMAEQVLSRAVIFQMTGTTGQLSVGHGEGGGSPGNVTDELGGYLVDGAVVDPASYKFGGNSIITDFHSARWFIGNNGRGGRSLYQSLLGGGAAVQTQEIAEGVENMSLTYLVPSASAYLDAASVGARWQEVTAVRISLQFSSPHQVGTDGANLLRTMTSVVSIRNRIP
ncbi:MAG: prepilin-type N-terminal cleavage/methylation domain-containing protein [Pseudomonadota bacterium]|nr:prepilin-type N-terminal cleavage/methylation domain-containing protein [Pseudomonadota bacterium]